jgi:hypothetical protein
VLHSTDTGNLPLRFTSFPASVRLTGRDEKLFLKDEQVKYPLSIVGSVLSRRRSADESL